MMNIPFSPADTQLGRGEENRFSGGSESGWSYTCDHTHFSKVCGTLIRSMHRVSLEQGFLEEI